METKAWTRIFENHISDKELESTIYKNLSKLSKKNPVRNWQKT